MAFRSASSRFAFPLVLLAATAFGCGETASTPPPAAPVAPAVPSPVASASPPAQPGAPAAPTWDAAGFRSAIDETVSAMASSEPIWATRIGDHRFDDQLPDLSEAGEAKRAADYTARAKALRTLASNAPEQASVDDAGTDRPALDARLLADRLDAEAFDLTTFRPLERDPSAALLTLGGAISSLTDHDYAPKATRLAALASRLAKAPAMFDAARARVKKPSHASLENLQVVAKGLLGMLRGPALGEWTSGLETGSPLHAKLGAGAKDTATALDAYVAGVLKAFPLASAKDEPIGAETWAKLAHLHEGVNDSAAEVRALGEKELARLQAELDALIASSGKKGDTRASFFARLEKETPPANGVLAEYTATEKRVESWMHEHPVVTVPWEKAKLVVVPTPPQQRGVSFASMNVAGVFDTISDARLEVNEPQPDMPAEKRQALLRFNALGAIDLVTLHEGMPGHYLQSLFVRAAPSKVRKLTRTATLGEGWAHYCEEMALENGYPASDPVRIKAFYLRMALQRASRVVVDVGENDGSLSLAQGAKFLEANALLAPEAAKIEARRAVVWPANMFSYTYGKLAILKIRDAVKAKEGKDFDLKRFHDRLLAVGHVPVGVLGKVAFGLD
ncbi:MAG TPA: DUF885 domain-containing protein [Polyangiaceae bacterium]|jgi:uncharacterized protein (DUF885 family)